jgi:hypothetical protein
MNGSAGANGSTGAAGAQGSTGAQGPAGATGPTGPKGGPAYARTIVVSPGGDAVANGTALLAAVASIKDSSTTNPYLVQIEPGTYDLNSQTLSISDGIDVAGSGQDATTILTTVSVKVGNVEVRELTLRGSGPIMESLNPTPTPIALRNVTVAMTGASSVGLIFTGSVTLDGLTITGSGEDIGVTVAGVVAFDAHNLTVDLNCAAGKNCTGVAIGSGVMATVRESTIDIRGGAVVYGMKIQDSSATLQNVAVTVQSANGKGGGAIFGEAGRSSPGAPGEIIDISGSTLLSIFDSAGSFVNDSGGNLIVQIADTQLAGPVLDLTKPGAGPVTLRCVGDYDANYAAVPDTCKGGA